MGSQPEDRRAGGRGVGAYALEGPGAIMERVRQDVDLSVLPRYETPVAPDLLGALHRVPLRPWLVGQMVPNSESRERHDAHRLDARLAAQLLEHIHGR